MPKALVGNHESVHITKNNNCFEIKTLSNISPLYLLYAGSMPSGTATVQPFLFGSVIYRVCIGPHQSIPDRSV